MSACSGTHTNVVISATVTTYLLLITVNIGAWAKTLGRDTKLIWVYTQRIWIMKKACTTCTREIRQLFRGVLLNYFISSPVYNTYMYIAIGDDTCTCTVLINVASNPPYNVHLNKDISNGILHTYPLQYWTVYKTITWIYMFQDTHECSPFPLLLICCKQLKPKQRLQDVILIWAYTQRIWIMKKGCTR